MKEKLEKEKKIEHRMYCRKSAMRCAVYHEDGVCPDIRDCEACKEENKLKQSTITMEITELGRNLFGNNIRVEKTENSWEVGIIENNILESGEYINRQFSYRIGKNPLEVKALIDMGIIRLVALT